MAIRKDLTGMIFGKLTVVAKGVRNSSNAVTWICKCVCGGKANPATYKLIHGLTTSCGCIRTNYGKVPHNRTHGETRGTPSKE